MSTTVSSACTEPPARSAPRIGAYLHDTRQFFIFIDGQVLCQVPTFCQALFLLFSSFYIFYLEYPKQVRNVLYFLQDYIFSYPDSVSRPASYLAIASDIKRNL